jgi:hypothetical protein
MRRIRVERPRLRPEHSWTEDPTADPRDPDVVRAKALARVFHELHAEGHHALCEVCGN